LNSSVYVARGVVFVMAVLLASIESLSKGDVFCGQGQISRTCRPDVPAIEAQCDSYSAWCSATILFVAQQRKAKLEGYVQTLAVMDELINFAAMAAAVDKACPRADPSKGGQPARTRPRRWCAWCSCRGRTTCRTSSASIRCSTD
jgi:hypothetical protein